MTFHPQVEHATAGPAARARLSESLALPGWSVSALCSLGPADVRVGLRRDRSRLAVHVGRRGVRVDGHEKLAAALAARLGAQALEDLRALISGDPETFVEWVPAPEATGALRVPIAAGPINLLEPGWRNFFADQDYEVLLGYPELKMNKTIYARYSDRECLYSWSGNDPRKWSFFAYPVREPSDSFGAAVFRTGVVMELEERDMVMGAADKADALVESVADVSQGSDADFVVFNHFCTSIVMGEDSGSITRRIEDASGRRSVCWTHGDRDQLDNFGRHFKTLFERPGFFDAAPDPGAVNLFHFPSDYREAELVPLLERMGVRVATRLFPDVEFPSAERIPEALTQVFCAATSYQSRLPRLFEGKPRPVITAPAPYGLKDTGECLAAIARAAGREEAYRRVWAEELKALKPEWEALTARARGQRLAFVVSETTLPRLWELRHGQGAPMMRMLAEMGFVCDILYYDPHDEPPVPPASAGVGTVSTFRTPRELERLLREGTFRAVYSDIFFDWRVSAAGKARFSSKDFEMGARGALRSLRRLLGVCRLPFYERYGAQLAAVPGRTLG